MTIDRGRAACPEHQQENLFQYFFQFCLYIIHTEYILFSSASAAAVSASSAAASAALECVLAAFVVDSFLHFCRSETFTTMFFRSSIFAQLSGPVSPSPSSSSVTLQEFLDSGTCSFFLSLHQRVQLLPCLHCVSLFSIRAWKAIHTNSINQDQTIRQLAKFNFPGHCHKLSCTAVFHLVCSDVFWSHPLTNLIKRGLG